MNTPPGVTTKHVGMSGKAAGGSDFIASLFLLLLMLLRIEAENQIADYLH